jgi:hypothetical protein
MTPIGPLAIARQSGRERALPHVGMFPKARSLPHLFCSQENGRPERGRPVVELAGVAQRPASLVAEGWRCHRATCVSSIRAA